MNLQGRYFASQEEALFARKCAECGGTAKIGSPIVKLRGTSAFHSYSKIFGALCSRCQLVRHESWEEQGGVTLPKRQEQQAPGPSQGELFPDSGG